MPAGSGRRRWITAVLTVCRMYGVGMDGPALRRDLYRGTAADYDRFRLPYPDALIDDLARRCGAHGDGRLLDLACGTGQISFATSQRFGEVWAVDQEPDMIAVVRKKAHAAGFDKNKLRALVSAAEDLSLPAETFDLVAIGNAFHRLPRYRVARLGYRALRPGGFLALLWSEVPWRGELPWQRALAAVVARWMDRAGGHDRVPADIGRARQLQPDSAVLHEAGFHVLGSYRFPTAHEWTPQELTGYVLSTSVLSRASLGRLATELAADLQRALHGHDRLTQVIDYAYELARRPG